MRNLIILAILPCLKQVWARAAFAHFMVGNTENYSLNDWEDDIDQAKAAHIDAFAMNMAYGEETTTKSLPTAFSVANSKGFKLFFSFDYAGNGSWPQSEVIALINSYKSNGAYYLRGSQPLVSTFEGPEASSDWPTIKSQTNCFFIPSWSSLGAKKAVATGVVDGLFSWAGWPEGPDDMYTTVDDSYKEFLGGKPYMMPVSPWFYTNMPGFRKNWIWRGDDLWFDRWNHVFYEKPEYIQILTWNDYGESHYIGPLRDGSYGAFASDRGKAPFNYAMNFPHDGWRLFLPYLIDTYKNNISSITQEGLMAWYRLTPASACPTGGTTGNTASQLQTVYSAISFAQDKIFYSALLASIATVTVTVGGVTRTGTWENTPDGGVGVYHGSISFGGTGAVTINLSRSGTLIATIAGPAITTTCTNGIGNFNPWVGSASAANTITAVMPPLSLAGQVCIEGKGIGKANDLCKFACKYSYCPPICTCITQGAELKKPAYVEYMGCPAPGYDNSYNGLCSFSCNLGTCPAACIQEPLGTVCSAPDPVPPPVPVCVAGRGEGDFQEICAFTCSYGFCPPEVCECTQAGTSAPTPPTSKAVTSTPTSTKADFGLCAWACSRGFCPYPPCFDLQGLQSIGDAVTENPVFYEQKLSATLTQNQVNLITYWTECDPAPTCVPGFNEAARGHGKVYDSDQRTYTANGCHGGGNGFYRLLCVESTVQLTGCDWYGKPKGCGQTCPSGYTLLGQNTHIAGYKTGCKTGYFSSYCCSAITSHYVLTQCPATNLNNIFTGGLGSNVLNVRSLGLYKDDPTDQTIRECDYATLGAAALFIGATYILNNLPGSWVTQWVANVGYTNVWRPISNIFTNKDLTTCTTTIPVHTKATVIRTPVNTGICDGSLLPQACAHYSSVSRNDASALATLVCPVSKMGNRKVPSLWNTQHAITWRKFVSSLPINWLGINPFLVNYYNKCERDEYPPFAFMAADDANYVQWIRFLPKWDNLYGGKIWGNICDPKSIESNVEQQGGEINDRKCTEIYKTVYTVNAFSMSFTNMDGGYDDMLSRNPCTPIITDDVGFALLNNDEWYSSNILSQHRPDDYSFSIIPAGLTAAGERPPSQSPGKRWLESEEDVLELLANRPPGYYPPTQALEFDPEKIVVNQGNTSRRATPKELLNRFGLVKCRSKGCEEERRLAGMALSESEQENASQQTFAVPSQTTAAAAASRPPCLVPSASFVNGNAAGHVTQILSAQGAMTSQH